MILVQGAKASAPLTARDCIRAVALHFDCYRNLIVPNVMMFGCELDVAILTPASFLTEVEVKISRSDWNADRHKAKWQDPQRSMYVDRFYYAVPFDLISKKPDWIPDEVGLLCVTGSKTRISVWKEAKKMGAKKLPNDYRDRMLASTYYRFWSSRGLPIEQRIDIDAVLGKS